MAATRTATRNRRHVAEETPEVETPKDETIEVEAPKDETDEIAFDDGDEVDDPEDDDEADEDEDDDEDEVDDKVETKTEPVKPTPHSPVTPFQACKRLNEALKAAGVNKVIQGPMMYTYASKGKFKTRSATKITAKGISKQVLEIDEESFTAWMTDYIASVVGKNVNKAQLQKVADDEAAKVDVAEDHEDDGVTTGEIEASEAE
jgi:hypothetical protein